MFALDSCIMPASRSSRRATRRFSSRQNILAPFGAEALEDAKRIELLSQLAHYRSGVPRLARHTALLRRVVKVLVDPTQYSTIEMKDIVDCIRLRIGKREPADGYILPLPAMCVPPLPPVVPPTPPGCDDMLVALDHIIAKVLPEGLGFEEAICLLEAAEEEKKAQREALEEAIGTATGRSYVTFHQWVDGKQPPDNVDAEVLGQWHERCRAIEEMRLASLQERGGDEQNLVPEPKFWL